MTEAEFEAYLPTSIEDYARERASNYHTPLDEERVKAREQIHDLLDEGLHTEGQHFWMLEHPADGVVGYVWVDVNVARQEAFIFDLAIHEARRGKGYGNVLLRLLDEALRTMGVRRVGLNVFASNTIAHSLYERHGFSVTNCNMQKEL
jgi:ribosomal protein S18 acetylase RimI-like enzyme